MIELFWKSGSSRGYTDLLPAVWFEDEGQQSSLAQKVRGPRGGIKIIRCAVTVEGRIASIDYGGDHTAFNERIFPVGITRLLFENARRDHVSRIQWRGADAKRFVDMSDGDVECRYVSETGVPPSFDPTNLADGRMTIERMVIQRQGQRAFRDALMTAYNNRCAVTGCTIDDVLEAAHISPHLGNHTNHVTNGLLLRADIHTLFDRGLIKVHDNYRITSRDDIMAIYGLPVSIEVPKDPNCRPNKKALAIKAKLS